MFIMENLYYMSSQMQDDSVDFHIITYIYNAVSDEPRCPLHPSYRMSASFNHRSSHKLSLHITVSIWSEPIKTTGRNSIFLNGHITI